MTSLEELELFLIDRIADDYRMAELAAPTDGDWHGRAKQAAGDTPLFSHLMRFDPAEVMAEALVRRALVTKARAYPEEARQEVLKAIGASYRYHQDFLPDWAA